MLPYNPAQALIDEAARQIAPGASDVTSGANSSGGTSPGLPVSSTTPDEDGQPISEAIFDVDDWDSDSAVWA